MLRPDRSCWTSAKSEAFGLQRVLAKEDSKGSGKKEKVDVKDCWQELHAARAASAIRRATGRPNALWEQHQPRRCATVIFDISHCQLCIPEDAELEEPEIFLDGDFSEEDSVEACFTAVGNVASCVSSQEHVVFNTIENRLKLRNHLHRASLLRRTAAEHAHATKHPCLPNKFFQTDMP